MMNRIYKDLPDPYKFIKKKTTNFLSIRLDTNQLINLKLETHNLLFVTCDSQLTTYNLQLTTCNLQLATSYSLLKCASFVKSFALFIHKKFEELIKTI